MRHALQEQIFTLIRAQLEGQGLLLKEATIADATIIAAPPSTKNEKRERNPEMKSTKKGNQWRFGMKVHAGTDKRGAGSTAMSSAGAGKRRCVGTQRACRKRPVTSTASRATGIFRLSSPLFVLPSLNPNPRSLNTQPYAAISRSKFNKCWDIA